MEVRSILNDACEFNDKNDITGLLIYSEGNFFQLIEGEKELIKELYYDKIRKDPRHNNLISFVETDITKPAFDGFYCTKEASRLSVNRSKLKIYFDHIKVLDHTNRKAVLEVLKSFFPDSEFDKLKENEAGRDYTDKKGIPP